jgi:hypothetical protein
MSNLSPAANPERRWTRFWRFVDILQRASPAVQLEGHYSKLNSSEGYGQTEASPVRVELRRRVDISGHE